MFEELQGTCSLKLNGTQRDSNIPGNVLAEAALGTHVLNSSSQNSRRSGLLRSIETNTVGQGQHKIKRERIYYTHQGTAYRTPSSLSLTVM